MTGVQFWLWEKLLGKCDGVAEINERIQGTVGRMCFDQRWGWTMEDQGVMRNVFDCRGYRFYTDDLVVLIQRTIDIRAKSSELPEPLVISALTIENPRKH